MSSRHKQHNYWVYILECNDQSYYTGVTGNLEKRVAEHHEGIDHRCFTHKRRPVRLVFCEHTGDIEVAISREKQIKGWSRAKKQALISNNWDQLIELSAVRKLSDPSSASE